MSGQEPAMPASALDMLLRGSKIEAIKIVRTELGLGLKDAKDMVEDYLDANPDTMARLRAADGKAARSFHGYVITVLALAALVYFFVSSEG